MAQLFFFSFLIKLIVNTVIFAKLRPKKGIWIVKYCKKKTKIKWLSQLEVKIMRPAQIEL